MASTDTVEAVFVVGRIWFCGRSDALSAYENGERMPLPARASVTKLGSPVHAGVQVALTELSVRANTASVVVPSWQMRRVSFLLAASNE
ncbi:unannotated protein [freshwater metagenome]|uniref:Unannotated protein n=1 Tax=freshwater metagenome TaxID=449393 RepID=A0A6J7EQ01_9ZZZZ